MSTRLLLCIILLSTLLGCGRSERMSIGGTVTLDGQPLKEGSIRFGPLPGTTGPTAGAEIVNGKFAIRPSGGPFAGGFRVQITAVGATGRKVFDPRSNATIDEYTQILPAQYNSRSQLHAEVTAGGPNRFDFALTSDKTSSATK